MLNKTTSKGIYFVCKNSLMKITKINEVRNLQTHYLSTKVIPNPLKNPNSSEFHLEKAITFNKMIQKPFDLVTNHQLKFKLKEYSHSFSDDIIKSDMNEIKEYFKKERILYDDAFLKNESISDMMWKPMSTSRNSYLALAKIRLTGLVASTALAGYMMAPGAFEFSTLLSCSIGVLLISSCANSMNQFFEVPFDSQMTRTMNRPLVKGALMPHQAVMFAGLTGTSGVALLLAGTNPLTTLLGLSNFFLYSFVYTPMKRWSIANTWVGSIVGAIPPAMGWTAATGSFDMGALLMGGLLYCWQFPHFNALSWNLQGDYSRAGYHMMSVLDPVLCKRVSLRYSFLLASSSVLFPLFDITTWIFAVDSLPPNLYLVYLAWKFYKKGDSSSSRKLFRFTLVHLPVLLFFLIISKKHYGEIQLKDSPVT